jgi:hypothetical protein
MTWKPRKRKTNNRRLKMYRIEGKNIVSDKSGKVVATSVQDNPGQLIDIVVNKGNMMKHKKTLIEWLKKQSIKYNVIRVESDKPVVPTAPEPVQESVSPTATAKAVATLYDRPASPGVPWPPWDPMKGFDTPGFQEWIKEHNLSREQVAQVVLRLEKNQHLNGGVAI